MGIRPTPIVVALLLLWLGKAPAAVFYVDLNSTSPTPPYATWGTAATDVQSAVDASSDGDLIWVNDGIFQTGGRVVYGSLTNRVVINKAVTVQSVNGPAVTTILGGNPAGNNAVRCVYLTNNAVLTGFTLTGGTTRSAGDPFKEESGGGAWCESTNCLVLNCILSSNRAAQYGGGVFGGALSFCVLSTNAANNGGDAWSNVLNNCVLKANYATISGGGAYGSLLSECTVAWNTNIGIFRCVANGCAISNNFCSGGLSGAGAAISSLTNCLVLNNISMGGGGGVAGPCVLTSCLVEGNISISAQGGGGALFSTLNNSVIALNTSSVHGAPQGPGNAGNTCTFNNCLIYSNSPSSYDTYLSTLNNCTITGGTNGLAAYGSNLRNCIVYFNSANYDVSSYLVDCCTMPLPSSSATEVGNFTNAPGFVNPVAGDFHLQSNSPCINAGNNSYATNSIDLDGNPRIVGGTVDIGAYEYQMPVSTISYAWLQQYGLPITTNIDTTDSDGTGMNNWQKWIAGLNPTNPASVLAMSPLTMTNVSTNGVTVRWQSVNTRTYYLLRATNLVAQPPFSAIQSNLVGKAGVTSFTDTSATNGGPYFYRVGVQ